MRIIDADKLIEELRKKEDIYRTDLTYGGIQTAAVLAAISEVKDAVEKASFESDTAHIVL